MDNDYVYNQSNNWQNNDYNQYNWNNEQSNFNSKPTKNKKKHKRGGCLLFILKVILLIVLIVLAKKGLDYWAKSNVEKFNTYYPFSFQGNDDRYNVRNDFYIQEVFYDENGQEYSVNWDINSKYINVIEDETDKYLTCDVNTDEITKQTTVTIKAVYEKLLFGKAVLTYDIILIPSESTVEDSINPIAITDAEQGSYPYKVQIRKNTDGYITSYTGDIRTRNDSESDWKVIEIQNEADAKIVLDSYKSAMSIPNEVQYKFDRVQTVNDIKNYIFSLSINNVKMDGAYAQIQVNLQNNNLMDITCQVQRQLISDTIQKLSGIQTYEKLDDSTVIQLLENSNKFNETCGDSGVYSVKYLDTKVIRGQVTQVYQVTTNDLGLYTVQISVQDQNNYEVLTIKNNVDTFTIPGPTDKEFDGEQVSGKYTDEYGTESDIQLYKIQSKGWFNDKTQYTLHDQSRQITVFDETFLFDLANGIEISDDENLLDVFKALGKLGIWGTINLFNLDTSKIINFESPDSSDRPAASQAYKNIQDAYDWYYNELGIVSYDNNGQPILIVDKYGKMTDNAACVNRDDGQSYFILCVPNKLKYSMCNDLTVMGHEYTHAVFNGQTGSVDDPGIELSGINEGCADIFGILMNSDMLDSWKIGENAWKSDESTVYVRDIANYSGDNLLQQSPKVYHGEGWEDEEHVISVLISHIAYEMYNSGKFTVDDIARIWLNSMQLGYNADQTFVDCRKNVMKSMLMLGYSKELQDEVARYWDAEEIFDPDYVITTTQEADDVLDSELSGELIEKLGTGELDTVIFMQTFGTILQDIPIYIWQEVPQSMTEMQAVEQQEFSELLQQVLGYKVVYKQIDSGEMQILKWFIGDANNKLDSIISNSTNGLDRDSDEAKFIDLIIKLAFFTGYDKASPYEVYASLYRYEPSIQIDQAQ